MPPLAKVKPVRNALADRDDLRLFTRRINGGLNGLAQRAALLRRIKALYRLG